MWSMLGLRNLFGQPSRGLPHFTSRQSLTRWHTKSSLLIISLLLSLLCHPVLCWLSSLLISIHVPLVAVAAASSAMSTSKPVDIRNDSYTKLSKKDILGEFDFNPIEPEWADLDSEEHLENERLTVETTEMWDRLEAAKKKLQKEHMNPMEETRTKDAVVPEKISPDDLRPRSSTGEPLLVVFTTTGCRKSEEALWEAQLAQPIIRDFGGVSRLATMVIEKKSDVAKRLGIKTVPCLRFYRDGNLESTDHLTYNGTDITNTKIAYWVLTQEEKTVQYVAEGEEPMRWREAKTTLGPTVYLSVLKNSENAKIADEVIKNKKHIPGSPIFYLRTVNASTEEQVKAYRAEQPFKLGESTYLALQDKTWSVKKIMDLILEVENRKIFYGDIPARAVRDTRSVLSVYHSKYENPQEIANLLLEFQPDYKDRITFYIKNNTTQTIAEAENIFSHSWGGAVLTDPQPNLLAYERASGVSRKTAPFNQYSLTMPLNYHSMKAFLEEWANGKRELHFRSNRYSYTQKDNPVMELSHVQLLRLLHETQRAPLGILYYEPGCVGCDKFLESWKKVGSVFAKNDKLKSQVLFGQINGKTNDFIDFDMREKMPGIAVYPPGRKALDGRQLYSGTSEVDKLREFMTKFVPKRSEL